MSGGAAILSTWRLADARYTGEDMRIIDDTSALNAQAVDVAARIGWVTRMARVTSTTTDDTRLSTVATRLGVSTSHLSRVETGKRRDGVLLSAYEDLFGLVEGTLRSPVDILCRTFPGHSPRDLAPGEPVTDVTVFSRLTEELTDGSPVTGGTWVRWARELARPHNVSLPLSVFTPLCHRLVNELGRSVAHAYAPRRDALGLLRVSGYGDTVFEIARDVLATSYTPGVNTLTTVVGKLRTPATVDWALDLLRADDDSHVEGGAHALEHMGQLDGGVVWASIADRLVDSFNQSRPDSAQEEWSAHLIRLVPGGVWRDTGLTPTRSLPPAPEIHGWSRDSDLWATCREAGEAATAPLDLPPQPMLTRLLFDATFSPWESRAAASHILLSAVPALALPLVERFAIHVGRAPESALRTRAARRLLSLRHGAPVPTTQGWYDSDSTLLRRTAYQTAGSSGTVLDSRRLRDGLLDPLTRAEAIRAAGMTQHPDLGTLATDTTLDPATRAGLAWWRGRGRITV